jgi:G:T-mismatch repair DNA endonuclease (very short patch repair protein)
MVRKSELYGDYWHKGQNPQDRIDMFKPFGFDTLVIWEKELKDMGAVTERIQEFHEAV